MCCCCRFDEVQIREKVLNAKGSLQQQRAPATVRGTSVGVGLGARTSSGLSVSTRATSVGADVIIGGGGGLGPSAPTPAHTAHSEERDETDALDDPVLRAAIIEQLMIQAEPEYCSTIPLR